MELSGSIRIRFITQHSELRVTADPFSVPSTLGRKGLSDILNQLLQRGGGLFDFLVYENTGDGPEGSLKSHARTYDLGEERMWVCEYAPSIPRPADGLKHTVPDWVSSMCGDAGVFVAGCYDGRLRVLAGSDLSDVEGHEGPVKAVAMSGGRVVSSGQDKVMRTWELTDGTLTPVAVGECTDTRLNHENSVESIAFRGGSILSGDWDGRLCVWSWEGAAEEAIEGKKRRLKENSTPALRQLNPSAAFKAHAHCVSGVAWIGDSACATASWDHSVKAWDVERQDCTVTLNGSKVSTCLAVGEDGGGVATGHPDGSVRLWDLRAGAGAGSVLAAGSWVSGLVYCGPLLAASTHDGNLRLFDTRKAKAMFTLKAHEDKALCVSWSEGVLASGGADCKLKTYTLSSAI